MIKPGSPEHVALWEQINALIVASGGKTDCTSTARMNAVASVEAALSKLVLPDAGLNISARPIEWEQHGDEYHDRSYGFWVGPDGNGDIHAAWGEDDAEPFDTVEDAQAWCQNQIDAFIRHHAIVTPATPDLFRTQS